MVIVVPFKEVLEAIPSSAFMLTHRQQGRSDVKMFLPFSLVMLLTARFQKDNKPKEGQRYFNNRPTLLKIYS